jgi:hypothetical protein
MKAPDEVEEVRSNFYLFVPAHCKIFADGWQRRSRERLEDPDKQRLCALWMKLRKQCLC